MWLLLLVICSGNQGCPVMENKPVPSLGPTKGRVNPLARYELKLDEAYFSALISENRS